MKKVLEPDELTAGYSQNGVTADLSGSTASYAETASENFSEGRRFSNETFSQGSSYVRNGKNLFSTGRLSGIDIIIDAENKTVVSADELKERIVVTDFSEGKCALNVDDGKYEITYNFEEKIPYADSISQEEFLLIVSDFEKKYPNNNLDSVIWKTDESTDKNSLTKKLQSVNVYDKAEQEKFINLVYDEKIRDDVIEEIVNYVKKNSEE